jgi:arginyl-tRNA synthetase
MQEKQTGDATEVSVGTDVVIGDLVEFYKASKKRFDEDADFSKASKEEVVKLQSGDEGSLRAWTRICDVSRLEFSKIYERLDVHINERGESFYNPMLASLVKELEDGGSAVQSEGASCIFLPGYTNPDGTPQPMIIKKSDGGFLYATTDLAAIRQRVRDEKADRVLYVTDVGQSQHFEMVFKIARATNLVGDKTELKHVPFGLVQGEDGKKFKSRSGDTVRLRDLLDQAVVTAEEGMLTRLIADSEFRSNDDDSSSNAPVVERVLTAAEKEVARIVGMGAVKYADLSMNRESNYRFSYNKMLSLTGNTAPYMLYAYARIQGISRKALVGMSDSDDSNSAIGGKFQCTCLVI